MDSRSTIGAALLTLAAACSVPERGSTEHFTASGEMIALSGGDAGAANACLTCHGVDGLGDGGGVPRLAGLSAGYLDAQLGAYADGRRYHERMAWISSQLTESERIAVSRYYSALPYEPQPAPLRTAPALYTMGDAGRGRRRAHRAMDWTAEALVRAIRRSAGNPRCISPPNSTRGATPSGAAIRIM